MTHVGADANLGVRLRGIDTARIDQAENQLLKSHQVVRHRGLRVLKNPALDAVPESDCEPITLPFRLNTAEASPVRAVLQLLVQGSGFQVF